VSKRAPQPRRSELVFLKHKLLDDRMIKPNSGRTKPLVFLKHKVFSVGAL
jgi:hypothetical protein